MIFSSNVHYSGNTESAKDGIKRIIEYIVKYLDSNRYKENKEMKYVVDSSIKGNTKVITIKRVGYKRVYRDYKGKLHYVEYPLEMVTISHDRGNIQIVYQSDNATHIGRGSINDVTEYIGNDINVITHDLI